VGYVDTQGARRRTLPRAEVHAVCLLTRHRGRPIEGETLDLGPGGMRVSTKRPLAVDELLAFDITLAAAEHIDGSARVVREQAPNVYALRFERLAPPAAGRLELIVAS